MQDDMERTMKDDMSKEIKKQKIEMHADLS
jgi:hypothetical protein